MSLYAVLLLVLLLLVFPEVLLFPEALLLLMMLTEVLVRVRVPGGLPGGDVTMVGILLEKLVGHDAWN